LWAAQQYNANTVSMEERMDMSTTDKDLRNLLKQLPEELHAIMNEAVRCVSFAPAASVKACRAVLVYVIKSLEVGLGEIAVLSWHKRIDRLQEKQRIPALTAIYMHTIFNLRDEAEYHFGQPTIRDAHACLMSLIAVMHAVAFPTAGPHGQASDAA
jgi:hypothetical protein